MQFVQGSKQPPNERVGGGMRAWIQRHQMVNSVFWNILICIRALDIYNIL